MRRILYIIILALTLLAPVNRLDVAKLLPVEAVAITVENNSVVLQTDSGDRGTGTDVASALEDLKGNATQIIYLDTARYLLIGEGAEVQAQQLMEHLKPTVKTGEYAGGDVKKEANYLDAHSEAAKPNT